MAYSTKNCMLTEIAAKQLREREIKMRYERAKLELAFKRFKEKIKEQNKKEKTD